ncbi:hypothetical protein [Actinoplanes sp. NPDC051411]|jgi:hypothetical protein|uniref:hypothetical protein n=1 Tax=Actinoplanes sp. NPDC051411 TaxID=3155522 RepID=UPI003415208D
MMRKKAWAAGIISGLIAFLTSLSTAFQGQDSGFETITMGQWITALIAFLVAFGGTGGLTYAVKNDNTSQSPAEQPDRATPAGPETKELVDQENSRP